MTDNEQTTPLDDADTEDSNAGPQQTRDRMTRRAILPWMITLLVAMLCAGTGLALGRLFAASRVPEPAEAPSPIPAFLTQTLQNNPATTNTEKIWYYEMEPVTVNLDEPNIRHHVRASVTLEIGDELDPSRGRAFFERKKTLMVDRLIVCLSGLNRDDIRNEGGIEKMQSQIRDALNKELFGGSEPHIRQALLKQLAIQ